MSPTFEERSFGPSFSEIVGSLLPTIEQDRRQSTFEFLCDNLPEFLSTDFISKFALRYPQFESELEALVEIERKDTDMDFIYHDVKRIMIVTKLAELIGLELEHYTAEEIKDMLLHLQTTESSKSTKFSHAHIIPYIMKGKVLRVSISIYHHFKRGKLSKAQILSGDIGKVRALRSKDKRIIKLAAAALNCLKMFDETDMQRTQALHEFLMHTYASEIYYKNQKKIFYAQCVIGGIALIAMLYLIFYFFV